MASVLQQRERADAQLAQRVGAGDGDAFALLDQRYRGTLTRYAATLLRRSEHDAEDVVQDVLIRVHQALRAGEIPEELRPWLYRLTRNRAIDEVRRKRWGDESLDHDHVFAGDRRDEPESMLRRKESLRRLVDDLADLPVRQREALLARELDGLGPEQVAAQLGVSVAAAQSLAVRARENLIKKRAARDADCDVVRAVLLDAHERGVRPTEHGLRHAKGCDACRAYQRDIRRLSRRLHALNPAFGLPLLAGLAKLAGGGGAGTAAVGAVAAVVIAVSGGIVVLDSEVFGPGDRAPFELHGTGMFSGRQAKAGDPVPSGTRVVTARVRVPAGRPAARQRSVTLACPAGMKLAGFENSGRVPRRSIAVMGFAADSIPGYSTRARIVLEPGTAPRRSFVTTVAILCRRPHPSGSLLDHPRLARRGERPAHVCVNGEQLYRPPPGPVNALLKRQRLSRPELRMLRREYAWYGYISPYRRPHVFLSLYRGQPVSTQRRDPTGRWTRVVTDNRLAGWVKTSALCA